MDKLKIFWTKNYKNLVMFAGAGTWVALEFTPMDHWTRMILESLVVFPLAFFMAKFRRHENGARHRLVAVETDEGWKYLENYPVFNDYHTEDGLFRKISGKERKNGVLI